MKKIYTRMVGLILATFLFISSSNAQTITGKVWHDKNADGLMTGETEIPAIVVELYINGDASNAKASTLTDASGNYTLTYPSPFTAGDYRIRFKYPVNGFTITTKRVGANNQINSAANTSGFTDFFNIPNNTTSFDIYSMGLRYRPNTITVCKVLPVTQPTWTTTITDFPRAYSVPDYLGGTLNQVDWFFSTTSSHPVVQAENTGVSSQNNVSLEGGSRTTVSTIPGTAIAPEVESKFKILQSFSPFDGTIDYAGTSGMTFNNVATVGAINNEVQLFDGSDDISGYINGGGQNFVAPITFSNLSVATVVGSATISFQIDTRSNAGGCVTYTYDNLVMPVELVSFNALKDGKKSQLTWATVSEQNNKGFYIERSKNGSNWESIGFVNTKSINGNSSQRLEYNFTDIAPLKGNNQYRLRQVDIDGATKYSDIRQLSFATSNISIYPNPVVNENVTIAGLNGNSKVTVTGLSGQVMHTEAINNASIKLINLSRLPKGIYLLTVTDEDGTQSYRQKLVKQ